jgi:hypothetical protein
MKGGRPPRTVNKENRVMTITTQSRKQAKTAKYKAVRDKGAAWLLDHMNPDGALGNPAEGFHFYRAPWTFTQVGATHAATAICGWIRREMLTATGEIAGPYRKFDDAYAYRNATLIVGAHRARQYDLSLGLVERLAEWQDPISGGSANDRLPDGSQSDDMDIPYACGPGFAFLDTGQIDRARKFYHFLKTIYVGLSVWPTWFYYAWSRAEQRPITEFPEAKRFGRLVDNQENSRQRWTIGGIAAGFLCRLYLAEPKPEYLELARKYQQFSIDSTDRQFDYPQVCKSSWGASLLYELTGEERYEAWTYRMGDWYADTQQADGHWEWEWYKTLGSQIELTLEFVMHVDTLIGGLASRP